MRVHTLQMVLELRHICETFAPASGPGVFFWLALIKGAFQSPLRGLIGWAFLFGLIVVVFVRSVASFVIGITSTASSSLTAIVSYSVVRRL
jgi:hypothetical protein